MPAFKRFAAHPTPLWPDLLRKIAQLTSLRGRLFSLLFGPSPRTLAAKVFHKQLECFLGFSAFCLFFGLDAVTIWGAIKSKGERAKLAEECNAAPMKSIFVMVWVAAAFMFFFGIVIPIPGEKEFFDTGLEVWKVGGLAFFEGRVNSWSVKL